MHSADDLQISRLRALRGPNYWRLAPVIACDIRLGDLEHASSADITDFTTRLLAILPGLEEHTCSCGESGRFVDRLLEGTFLPHVLEHVALELQALAGSDVRFGRVAPSGDPGVWWVIVAYEEEEVGLAAVAAGVDILRACISGHRLDSQSAIAALQDLHEEVRLGPSTAAIVEEARRRGIPVRRLNNRSLIQLGLGRNQRRVQATMTDTTSAIAAEIAQNKDETKRVLRHTGLPVPRGEVATSIEEAVAFAEEIGYPLLLKPLDASHGRGISQRLTSPAQLREAWAAAAAIAPQVLVEQFAQGRDHRVLVVNGAVVAVAERVPAHVVGDGSRTIAQLIDQENQDPRRGVGHRKPLTQLPADEHTAAFLARHGLALDSVPGRGETVFLRATANLSTGGTSIDRTDDIHPDNVTACQLAAHAVGLDVAGIDIMTRDISVPLRENGAVILEVNAAPGIRMHTHPAVGPARNVAAPVIDMLFPPGTPTTIPIIAVTGTNGKTTTVRLIAHLFRHTGKAVGFTTTDGIYLQNRLVMEGDTTGPFSANVVLSNPTVDVAVLETARGGLIRAGLGFEEADVGVVLNVSSDHLGLGGITTLEQLADVKAVVAAVVKREGHAVLNADDPRVYAMRHKTPGDVVLLSSGRDSTVRAAVEDHVADHGIAVCVEDDTFVIRRGRLRIPIAGVREVPLTMGGAARFQIGNVLAAIAAGYVQGVRYDDVRAGLLSFFPSPAMTPGRLNVMRVGDGRVIVDYAHNRAAMEALLDFAWCVPAERRVGVIAVPGDRRDDDVRAVGRLAARLDSVIIKEDEETRGRTRGVVAELLREGLHEGGMSDDRIEIIHDEREAVTRVLDRLDADTLGMVFAANVRSVLSLVEARARASARTSARGE